MIPLGTTSLGAKELRTHVHCIGSSQMGKTRLIEHICVQLLIRRKGFMLIDPLGKSYDRVIRRVALLNTRKDEVTLFDPAATNPHGFDPFSFRGTEDELYTRAEALSTLTLQIWGIADPNTRPQFKTWLPAIYYTLMKTGMSIDQVLSYMEYDAPIPPIEGKYKRDWERVHTGTSRRDFEALFTHLRSRFDSFAHPRLQKILSRDTLDVPGIIDRKGILLCKLKESNVLGSEGNETLAALFIGTLWQHFLALPKKTEFYVLIDEFQMLATERVATLMDQAGGNFGLHLMVFHQREGQMSQNLLDSMSMATGKLVFTGEREFTLNGVPAIAPHVPDLEKNPALDELTQKFVESLQPPPFVEPPPRVVPVEPHPLPGKGGAEHVLIQDTIKRAAEDKGFKADIEKDNVDVSLEGHGLKIAVEISVNSTVDQERKSYLANLSNGYHHSIVITTDTKKAEALKRKGVTAFGFQDFVPFLKSLMTEKLWLDSQEVADLLGHDVTTIRKWAKDKTIPSIQHGRQYRFDREKILTFGKTEKLDPKIKLPKLTKTPKKKKGGDRYRDMLGID